MANYTEIVFTEEGQLVSNLRQAFHNAILGKSNIDRDILNIEGMSGRCYRHFINNLVASIPQPRYLEIGSWAGSTLCSAISNNNVEATAIDNWSEFGGPRGQFLSNLGRFQTSESQVRFIESDFRAVNYKEMGKHNLFLFDGPHEFEDQYDGLAFARPALDNNFVFIVDDWNWSHVREGTLKAIQDLNFDMVFSMQVRSTLDNSHGVPSGAQSDWHNGYLVAILQHREC